MRIPIETELRHLAPGYDPTKAREYYLRTRKLKGQQRGSSEDPRTGKTRAGIASNAQVTQRKELGARIQSLSKKLQELEAKIREKEQAEANENRKGKAKKERAAKERDKPKSAAEKAKAVRENEMKHKAKEASSKSGGGSSSKKSGLKTSSVSELKTLATKVKGQIAVAKQKLAAL